MIILCLRERRIIVYYNNVRRLRSEPLLIPITYRATALIAHLEIPLIG